MINHNPEEDILENSDELIEAAVLLLNFKECFCVPDGGVDLAPVPDDPSVRHKGFDLCVIIQRDLLGIEIVKGGAKGFPFFQHGDPCQSGLHPLQDQHLKQLIIIMEGLAPFVVVVVNVYLGGFPKLTPQAFRTVIQPTADKFFRRRCNLFF